MNSIVVYIIVSSIDTLLAATEVHTWSRGSSWMETMLLRYITAQNTGYAHLPGGIHSTSYNRNVSCHTDIPASAYSRNARCTCSSPSGTSRKGPDHRRVVLQQSFLRKMQGIWCYWCHSSRIYNDRRRWRTSTADLLLIIKYRYRYISKSKSFK